MLRISKLTDYGIVLMAHLAREGDGILVSAPDLATATRVAPPTVSKLLKILGRADLLTSTRGAHGGYRLARPASEIDVAELIEALEGPLAMTECADERVSSCEEQTNCPLRGHWNHINLAVKTALRSISLAQLASPIPQYNLVGKTHAVEPIDA